MKAYLAIAAVSFGLSASLFAQTGMTVGFSPVPLWQQSGDVSGSPASQYVFLELSHDDYVVALRSPAGAVERLIHAPLHNWVEPTIAASVSRDSDGHYHYSYVVTNASTAQMPLRRWALGIENIGHGLALSHPVWKGGASSATLPGVSRERHEVYQWESPEGALLQPGATLAGFEIVSDLAPGFVLAAFYGENSVPELTREDWASLPEAAAAQLRQVLGTAWDSQTQHIIGPQFAPGDSVTEVQANFLTGMRIWKMSKILGDSDVVKSLETALTDALSEPDKVVSPEGLASLRPKARSKEEEVVSALRLIFANPK